MTRTIDYDATGPVATAALERGPDVDGWYGHPVAAAVGETDETSGLAGCTGATCRAPTGRRRRRPGSARIWPATPTSAPVGVALNYDATPPAVVATLARAPDSNGWFNHPVAATGAGTDGAPAWPVARAPPMAADASGVSLAVRAATVPGTGAARRTSRSSTTPARRPSSRRRIARRSREGGTGGS